MRRQAVNTIFLKSFLLFFLLLLSIPAFRFFAGQFYYQQAQLLIEQDSHSQAVDILFKAAQWLPCDDQIQHSLGILHLVLAGSTDGLLQTMHIKTALQHLHKAAQLNPLEPEFALSIAYALEQQSRSSSGKILLAYQRVVALSPNAVQYRTLLADKLYLFGRERELQDAAEMLGRIYPGVYWSLLRKSWWTPLTEQRFAKGLLQAVEQNNDVRKARMALVDMKVRQHNWTAAAEQLRQALTLERHRNKSSDYFQLATYYLHDSNLEAAYEAVAAALLIQQVSPESLRRIWTLFQKTGQQTAFPDFYLLLRSRLSFTYVEDLDLVEILIAEKEYLFALKLLERVILERDYLAKPWRLRAEIYRRQGNIPAMEAAASKAELLAQ